MDEREVIEMAQRGGPRQFHAGQDDLRQRVEALEKAVEILVGQVVLMRLRQ
jgi:hypothetical protein